MERLQGGNELPSAASALIKFLGVMESSGFIAEEIGGGNGVQPMIVAAETGKTVIDCDLMGRAYPNVSCPPPPSSAGRSEALIFGFLDVPNVS